MFNNIFMFNIYIHMQCYGSRGREGFARQPVIIVVTQVVVLGESKDSALAKYILKVLYTTEVRLLYILKVLYTTEVRPLYILKVLYNTEVRLLYILKSSTPQRSGCYTYSRSFTPQRSGCCTYSSLLQNRGQAVMHTQGPLQAVIQVSVLATNWSMKFRILGGETSL